MLREVLTLLPVEIEGSSSPHGGIIGFDKVVGTADAIRGKSDAAPQR